MNKSAFAILIMLTLCATASAQMAAGASAGATASRLQDSIAEKQRQQMIQDARKEFDAKKAEEEKKKTAEVLEKKAKKEIQIDEISFSPSEILPKEFLAEIKKKYEGKLLSIDDINEIITSINNQYILLGAIGAKAYLDDQDVSKGKLFISLVEGKVRKVNVEGSAHTSESYIKEYFKFKGGTLVDVKAMQDDVQYFNASNDAKARLALEPGPVYGTSDVTVSVTEPDMWTLSAFTDNAGQDSTGLYRVGGYGVLRSATGRRDILTAGGTWSEGSYSAFGIYEIPEPVFNTRIGIGADYSETDIINGSLKNLDIKGDFYNVYVYVKKPFCVTEAMVNNLTLQMSTKHGQTKLSGYEIPGGTNVNLLSLTYDNLYLFDGAYLYNNVSAGANIAGPSKSFYKFSYYGEYQQVIVEDFTFTMKFRAQYGSDDSMASSDQFQIGGSSTVRGYGEGALLANSGLSGTVEFAYDIAPMIGYKSILTSARLFAFFDYGLVFARSGAPTADGYDDAIYSAGVGAKCSLWENVNVNLTYAQPLVSNSYANDGQLFLFYIQLIY